MNNIFYELTLVLIGAGIIAYVLHFLKQPSIIAYIIAGLMIGPIGIYKMHNGEILHGLAEVGITLLLFMVGLDLDLSQLKRIGKAAIYTGLGQVVFTCLIGLGIIKLLGFDTLPALYIAIALTFSSTIIVVKLLTEKKDLHSLYGKLAVGIFLIQDVAAIFILIFLSSYTGMQSSPFAELGLTGNIILTIAKAFMAGVAVVWLSRHVFPHLIKTIGKSDELLLIFALGWSLGLASVFSLPIVGFNAAIGGFVAGLALANTGVHHQISGRIRSLRDFFIIIFFIFLGSQLVFSSVSEALVPAIILSLFVLIGNPLIVTLILGFLGYKPRISFMTGVTVAQISEFSLILMAVGLAAGHVTQTDVTVVTMVGIITIALSSYGILYAEKLYQMLQGPLEWFNFKRKRDDLVEPEPQLHDHIVLVGAHRLGTHIINSFGKKHNNVLIVDFNPDIIHFYGEKGFRVLCGDIADPYIQEVANLDSAKLVIATIPDFHDTLALLEFVKRAKKRIKTIVAASDEHEAEKLYKAGADYVLMPHFIGGLHLANIVEVNHDLSGLRKLKQQHIKTLKDMRHTP